MDLGTALIGVALMGVALLGGISPLDQPINTATMVFLTGVIIFSICLNLG